MTKILNSLLIAASVFTFAPAALADGTVDITADFLHDAALTAEENYQHMLETADQACDVLEPSGAVFPLHYAREALADCQTDLVEQAVTAFQRPDLAAVHHAITGNQIQLAELTQ
ncbi:MAG: hypothetical protein AAFZ74_08960 [Pseudomonadota bacterium]